MNRKEIKLYNVLFPLWMLMLFPAAWLVIIPGNFIIDSLVLLIGTAIFRAADKKGMYKRHILPVYIFGMISDIIGAAYMFILIYFFEVGRMGDELYLTLPALVISAVLIFVFDYFISFRKAEKGMRLKMAILFSVATAPYTFLIPSTWLYG